MLVSAASTGAGVRGIPVERGFRQPGPGFAMSFWGCDVTEADGKTLQLQKLDFHYSWICSLSSPHRMMIFDLVWLF